MNATKSLSFLNSILSAKGGWTTWAAYVSACASLFLLLQALLTAAGVVGSYKTVLLEIVACMLLVGSLFFLRLFRWNILHWALRKNVQKFLHYDPSVIVGVGPGGAILAGMIAKIIAQHTTKEPAVFVVDRVYKNEGRTMSVQLGKNSCINFEFNSVDPKDKRVLIVTPEIHSGNTIKTVCEEFEHAGLDHKVFALTWSVDATATPDMYLVRSNERGLIPWPDTPERTKMEGNS